MFLSKKWIACKWMVDIESFSSTWGMINFILFYVVLIYSIRSIIYYYEEINQKDISGTICGLSE
jgi:hypothetical protein